MSTVAVGITVLKYHKTRKWLSAQTRVQISICFNTVLV